MRMTLALIARLPLRQTHQVLITWKQFRSLCNLLDVSAIIHTLMDTRNTRAKRQGGAKAQSPLTCLLEVSGLLGAIPSRSNQSCLVQPKDSLRQPIKPSKCDRLRRLT